MVKELTMYCQRESLILGACVVITHPPLVARRKSGRSHLGTVGQCRGGDFSIYIPFANCHTH